MKAQRLLLPLLTASLFGGPVKSGAQTGSIPSQQIPAFVENRGQITDQAGRSRIDVGYHLKVSSNFNVFLGPGLLQYQWCRPQGESNGAAFAMRRLDVRLLGANPDPHVEATQRTGYREQYQLSGLRTEARAFRKITYREVYPHIDWVVYLNDKTAEYDFIVRPGGKVSDIKLRYGGASRLRLNADGTLTATTPMGTVTESAPASHARGRKVASAFTLTGNVVGFRTAPYKGTLTIDPALIWGTYIGGALNEFAYGLATDKSGNVYMAGSTASTANIATTGAYQVTYGGGTGGNTYVGDAYLAKFSPAGTPLWITYYGGTGADQGYSLCTDSANRVYLAGFTTSASGIATTGAQQATIGGGTDAFLACFDSSGARQWATYFGGPSNENNMTSVRYSQSGNAIYLSGITNSSSGVATAAAQQPTFGGSIDAFLAKFSLSGALQWATYYGGTGNENNFAQAATDKFGNVYLCGISNSAGLATTGSHQPASGGANDGFLVKFNGAGVRQWSTYYGGSDYDRIHSIVCNDSGYVYALGSTWSTTGIATPGSFQSTNPNAPGYDNPFLVKFDSSGLRQWATYYSGNQSAPSASGALSLSATGNIYFTGSTSSTTGIATPGTLKDTLTVATDAFLVKFSPGGQRLWGTYYGGGVDEIGRSSVTDHLGNVYISGETSSGNGIATTGAYQGSFGGGNRDGYLVKFNDCDTPATPAPIAGPAAVCKGGTYTYSIPPMSGALSYTWILPGGWVGSSTNNSITLQAGEDTGSIQVFGIFPCINSPIRTLSVSFLLDATINPAGAQAVCSGDTLTLHAPAGNPGYQWLNGGTAIAGATDSTLRVYAAGYYSVIVTGAGCTDTSAVDTFTVHALPVPLITANGMNLTTGSFAAYQWAFNGGPITGANAQSYTATLSGNYIVTVTDTNGCTGTSAIYNLWADGIADAAAVPVRIYPNPATTSIRIEAPIPVLASVSSMDGRQVIGEVESGTLDVSHLATGVYQLRITNRQGALLRVTRLTIAPR